jgi:hypothetical protein
MKIMKVTLPFRLKYIAVLIFLVASIQGVKSQNSPFSKTQAPKLTSSFYQSQSTSNFSFDWEKKADFQRERGTSILDLFGLTAAPNIGWYNSRIQIPENEYFNTDFLDYNVFDFSVLVTVNTPIVSFSRNINYQTFVGNGMSENIQLFEISGLGLVYLGNYLYKKRNGRSPEKGTDLQGVNMLAVLLPYYRRTTVAAPDYSYKSQEYSFLGGFYVRKIIVEEFEGFYSDFNNIQDNPGSLRISYYGNELGVTESSINYFSAAILTYSGLGIEAFEKKRSGWLDDWFAFPYGQINSGEIFIDSFDGSEFGQLRYQLDYFSWKLGGFFWFGKQISKRAMFYGIAVAYPISRFKLDEFKRTENIPINQDVIRGRGGNYFFRVGLSYQIL